MYDADGNPIVYSAKEKYMDGYMTIYDVVTNFIHDGGTIINRSITTFKVQKIWTGLEEGTETPEITLVLYCNGKVYDCDTPAPDKYGWYRYNSLPLYVNGERAVYSIVEEPPEGYASTYTNNGEAGDCACDGGVITNHLIPKTGDEAPVMLQLTALLTSAAAMLLMSRRRRG